MAHLTEERVLELKAIARKLRVDILEMITKAASGHTGGSLSIADLITLLYFEEMHIDPANPKMADRDRLVLSKGHAVPAMYAALAEKGYSWAGDFCCVRNGTCLPNGSCFLESICDFRGWRTGRRPGMGSSYVCCPLQAGPSDSFCR